MKELDDKSGVKDDVVGRIVRAKNQRAMVDCTDANNNTPLSEAASKSLLLYLALAVPAISYITYELVTAFNAFTAGVPYLLVTEIIFNLLKSRFNRSLFEAGQPNLSNISRKKVAATQKLASSGSIVAIYWLLLHLDFFCGGAKTLMSGFKNVQI